MAVVKFQLRRLGKGKPTRPDVSPVRALVIDQWIKARRTRQYRRVMGS